MRSRARTINDSGAIVGTATYTPTNSDGTPGTPVQHGVLLAPAYEIQVDAFIPEEYVGYPANPAIEALLFPLIILGNPDNVYYAGDRRKTPLDASFTSGTAIFDKGLTFRLQQKVMATVFKELDPDGSQEHEESNEAQLSITGTTKLYLGYQISGGHISPSTSPWLTAHCTPTSPNVTVTHPSSRVVNVELTMQGSDPLAPGAWGGPIYYDITVSIDATNPADPKYTLSGNHKLFPAYEVYINKQLVHDYSPIPGGNTTSGLLTPDSFAPDITSSSITSGTTKPVTGDINP